MSRDFRIRPWLELTRVPNLFTVPGDPLAGAMVATHGAAPSASAAALAMGTSLCLYAAGLIHNDWCDLETDRRERPERPLPRGAIHPRAALAVASVLAVTGLALAAAAGCSAAILAGVLALLIALYNAVLKRGQAGPLAMGLCRGLSFLLGAAAGAGPGALRPDVAIPAVGLTAYIAAVTVIAAREMETGTRVRGRWMPLAVLAATFAALAWRGGSGSVGLLADPVSLGWFSGGAAASLAAAGSAGWRLADPGRPGGVPPIIGRLIRALIPVQVAFCAWGGGGHPAVLAILLLAWPLAAWAGRRFYAS